MSINGLFLKTLLKEGGKIKLFVPPELAYGDRGPLAHRVLVFDVELLTFNTPGGKKHAMNLRIKLLRGESNVSKINTANYG